MGGSLLVESGYAALFGVDGGFAAGVYKKLPHLTKCHN